MPGKRSARKASKEERNHFVKAIHFGPEDDEAVREWAQAQPNFSAAVKALIRKELGLPTGAVDQQALRDLVERLVAERLAQVGGTPTTAAKTPTAAPQERREASSDEPPPDLFKGIF